MGMLFEQLSDIYVDSSKHKPVPPVNVSNIDATVVKEDRGEAYGNSIVT